MVFSRVGIPLDLMALVVFGVAVLLIDSLATKGKTQTKRICIDWAPLVGVLIVYDLTGDLADTAGMPLQIEALIEADRAMFFGQVPTVWLQQRLLGPRVGWWEVVLAAVYLSHFFLSPAVLLSLYGRSRARWVTFARQFLTLNALGMLTYVLVPAAPPWWASERGHLPAGVDRVLGRGWDVLGLKTVDGLVVAGREGVNEVAALPSLHAGYAALIALALWPSARRSRFVLVAYAVVMAFALVYGGEHYVVDILLGWLYAVVAVAVWRVLDARRAARNDLQPSQEALLQRR